jgi:adenosylmethionine-8-amino-7-oxononanoate aminotransferase
MNDQYTPSLVYCNAIGCLLVYYLCTFHSCSSSLAPVYRQHIEAAISTHEAAAGASSGSKRLGALLVEPVLQGAGGMLLPDPLFQAEMVKVRLTKG